jgi:hypothetical protein
VPAPLGALGLPSADVLAPSVRVVGRQSSLDVARPPPPAAVRPVLGAVPDVPVRGPIACLAGSLRSAPAAPDLLLAPCRLPSEYPALTLFLLVSTGKEC